MGAGLEGPGLIIILVIVLVLFGGSKLPALARGLGQAKREFEVASSDPAEPTSPAVAPEPDDKVTISRADYEALKASRSSSGGGHVARGVPDRMIWRRAQHRHESSGDR